MNIYYTKEQLASTPTIKQGLSPENESKYRREGILLIVNLGKRLSLRYDTVATAAVFFNRFYMAQSYLSFPPFVTACSCLFLAGKVEETPKKCKDIIKVAQELLTEQQFLQFRGDPREEMMMVERVLLHTIKFEFQVEHPYAYLIKYVKCIKGEADALNNLLQAAWSFTNDSLSTTLCLEWEPQVVAISVIYLACKIQRYTIKDWVDRRPEHRYWWDNYVEGLEISLLEDICHQILDLYYGKRDHNDNTLLENRQAKPVNGAHAEEPAKAPELPSQRPLATPVQTVTNAKPKKSSSLVPALETKPQPSLPRPADLPLPNNPPLPVDNPLPNNPPLPTEPPLPSEPPLPTDPPLPEDPLPTNPPFPAKPSVSLFYPFQNNPPLPNDPPLPHIIPTMPSETLYPTHSTTPYAIPSSLYTSAFIPQIFQSSVTEQSNLTNPYVSSQYYSSVPPSLDTNPEYYQVAVSHYLNNQPTLHPTPAHNIFNLPTASSPRRSLAPSYPQHSSSSTPSQFSRHRNNSKHYRNRY